MKLQTVCTLALAGVMTIALSVSAVASEGPVAKTVTTSVHASDAPDDPTDGKGVFMKYCKKCHGADGKGKKSRIEKYTAAGETYPDFTAKKRSAADVAKVVKNGKRNKNVTGGKMPGFGDNTKKKWLTEAQIKAVSEYVAKL